MEDWEIIRYHEDGFVDRMDYTSYASSGKLKGITLVNMPVGSQVGYDSTQEDFKLAFQNMTLNMGFEFTPFVFSSNKNLDLHFLNCSQNFWLNTIEITTKNPQGTLTIKFQQSSPTPKFLDKLLSTWNGNKIFVDGTLTSEAEAILNKHKNSKAAPLSVMLQNMSLE